MQKNSNFTEGKILLPLMKFMLPVLAALVLQALYGAVDLLVVGQYSSAEAVSAVATGSQIMHTITAIITGLAMGVTILIGHQRGQKDDGAAGDTIGSGICLFLVVGAAITLLMLLITRPFVQLMQAPPEAFESTVAYVMVCSAGTLFIAAYNVLGSIFRGIGDSKTPLMAVCIACGANIALDMLFVAVFHMGAAGAAWATTISQGLSVIISLLVIRRRGLGFAFSKNQIRFNKALIRRILTLGAPCALQDLLVSLSFLIILAIVNTLGVNESAGVGVAEKLCMFIMLVPSSYMQAMSAFVAQNIGAGKPDRAKKTMYYGMISSLMFGVVMAYVAFFHGQSLARIFARDEAIILNAAEYLKAYGIDTMLVSFLFCFMGYFNGCDRTAFVMAEGLIGAFVVRVPLSYMMSLREGARLFDIGVAIPCSTVVQILLCIWYFRRMERQRKLQA